MYKRKYTIEEIRELLLPLLREVPVSKAVLFGSYARNEATADSDIDLFVDTEGRLKGLAFIGFCEDVKEKVQKSVDVFEKSYLDPASELYSHIESEGVIIYGN